jgi:hypothetical protein
MLQLCFDRTRKTCHNCIMYFLECLDNQIHYFWISVCQNKPFAGYPLSHCQIIVSLTIDAAHACRTNMASTSSPAFDNGTDSPYTTLEGGWDYVRSNVSANAPERFMMATWSIFTALACIGGNVVVLIGSLKYKAVKLDKITVVLIENLATADTCYAAFYIAPRFVNLIADGNVLGDTIGSSTLRLGYTAAAASILLITSLNISKLTCLLDPLGALSRSAQKGRLIAITIWCLAAASVAIIDCISSAIETGGFAGTRYY